MFRKVFGRTFALVAMLAVMAGSAVMPVAAQAETIYTSDIRSCDSDGSTYTVTLEFADYANGMVGTYPETVQLHFLGGITADVTFSRESLEYVNYVLWDFTGEHEGKFVTGASATFDTSAFPDPAFFIASIPCYEGETSTVSGTVIQHGNRKPVEGLTVCVVEVNRCATTDENGLFSISGVPNGTFTLVSDGPVYKPLSTSVTVDGADLYFDLTQYRGGGRD